uniref:Macaca fascicularis brain cDNA clone: QccE-21162, similar to human nucleoporin 62kDa (NUP62), transcript variant 1, mRNA, RefSeq: NM_153719.2 n=1 Tax=Macaca fascicularis TaxID=9541 RepID=I7G441_MACFA|nr:unnamed protein product [Macaca fascicularis]
MVKPVSTKNTKISQVWWVPVISATREAEAGESLEPGRCCSEPGSHHCTPAWQQRLSQKKKKKASQETAA